MSYRHAVSALEVDSDATALKETTVNFHISNFTPRYLINFYSTPQARLGDYFEMEYFMFTQQVFTLM